MNMTGKIIRAGDLCIHRHVSTFMGIVLNTVVKDSNTNCDIFWIDLMKVQTNTIGQGFLEIYRIVR